MFTVNINPKSLKDLCIHYVCDNVEMLFTSDVYLPMEISEALLLNLSLQNQINNKTLSLFSSKNAYLRNIKLPIANNVTPKGLGILKTHNIKRIEINSLNCRIDKFIGLLNIWTIQNLESLNVSNMNLDGFTVSSALVSDSITKLKNLHSLDVSKTNFSTNNLFAVVEDLPHLESLNISNTKVDNLLPLEKIKNKLKILSVYNLREAIVNMIDFVPLRCMTTLTHLDLSLDLIEFEFICYKTLLTDPYWSPDLVALDISGSESVGPKVLEDFLTIHKHIKFLGLMYMDDSGGEIFTNRNHPLYNKDLMVTGCMIKNQLLLSMKCYTNRSFYIYSCLDFILRTTESYKSPKFEIIKVVLAVMKCLRDDYLVQTLATACLNNLTKRRLASKIHPTILSVIVGVILDTMKRFYYVRFIQENTFSILNNKFLLNNVKMDYVSCAKLVLNAFHFSDTRSTRISLFSKLASKMSLSEISQLKPNTKFILSFFGIIYEKLTTHTIDSNMKCSISALWSLTDESSSSCELFLELDGLQIFMIILNTFMDYSSLEGKVLKVLINISKIPHLRTILLNNGIIPTLRRLLQSTKINVSYCAAEIIARLSCEPNWKAYTLGNKAEVLKELQKAVKQWDPPERIIVMYRSFRSFKELFNLTNMPQVQLWAAWAILHACTTNVEKYCEMLDRDIGVVFFQNISSNESIDREVRELCDCTIDLINYFR